MRVRVCATRRDIPEGHFFPGSNSTKYVFSLNEHPYLYDLLSSRPRVLVSQIVVPSQ